MAIFCKVPITTLAECKYVCKSWIDILSHHIFANTFKQSTTSTGATSLVLCVKTDDLYFLEFPQGSESPYSFNLVAEFVKRPPQPEALEHNHRLREYITLLPFEEERERDIAVDLCGIGFSLKTN
ncbi:unnamed protein product [Dovyalis caffra]|uniref:F-box domain-containing protein n=1 Tax=Dovyalis caffra TaxID=77055 RepID=A0AAV1S5G8_9ROSI|nr:unnamed protein product [Dovyalis caffra]